MNLLPILFLLVSSTLVLRSGDRIIADGPVKEENGVVTFRAKGTLYSLPAIEIDRIEDASANAQTAEVAKTKFKVSEEDRKRLLAELEANHSGTVAPQQQRPEPLPPPPTAAQQKGSEEDEWAWRREARAHEEAICRAKEELELLQTRAEELRRKILQLTALGYKPSSFTYDSIQLTNTLDAIPRAELEVTRAQRAFDEFREEARRRGIMPGWLR
ncbi:MAG: hypothetical protein DMF56_09635 [Acidobacteria bacterium]|nr:MAG: hypothetical protein DMF56_09635 [Acidobacteriota bacterium]